MKLIVGLGNPEPERAYTRHNIGWLCIDYLIDKDKYWRKYDAQYWFNTKLQVGFLKPLTTMNFSGTSVAQASIDNNLKPKDILIIMDDLHLPFGKLRLRPSGSAGGHNGLKSIIEEMGTNEIPRLKIGLGDCPKDISMLDFVLGEFTDDEKNKLLTIQMMVKSVVAKWLTCDIDKAMTEINSLNIDLNRFNVI